MTPLEHTGLLFTSSSIRPKDILPANRSRYQSSKFVADRATLIL